MKKLYTYGHGVHFHFESRFSHVGLSLTRLTVHLDVDFSKENTRGLDVRCYFLNSNDFRVVKIIFLQFCLPFILRGVTWRVIFSLQFVFSVSPVVKLTVQFQYI